MPYSPPLTFPSSVQQKLYSLYIANYTGLAFSPQVSRYWLIIQDNDSFPEEVNSSTLYPFQFYCRSSSRQERSKTHFLYQLTSIVQKVYTRHGKPRILGFNNLFCQVPCRAEIPYWKRQTKKTSNAPSPPAPSLESCLYGNGIDIIKVPVPSLEQ